MIEANFIYIMTILTLDRKTNIEAQKNRNLDLKYCIFTLWKSFAWKTKRSFHLLMKWYNEWKHKNHRNNISRGLTKAMF